MQKKILSTDVIEVKPVVVIFSQASNLARALIKNLNKNLCQVKVVSNSFFDWSNLSKRVQLPDLTYLEIVKEEKIDYLIFIIDKGFNQGSGQELNKDLEIQLKVAEETALNEGIKIFLIAPLKINADQEEVFKKIKALVTSSIEKTVTYVQEDKKHGLDVDSLSLALIKRMFSFSSGKTHETLFIQEIDQAFENKVGQSALRNEIPKQRSILEAPDPLALHFLETNYEYNFFSVKRKLSRNAAAKSLGHLLTLVLIGLFVSPLILLFTSVSLFKASKVLFSRGNLSYARNITQVTQTTTKILEVEIKELTKLPFLRGGFENLSYYPKLFNQLVRTSARRIVIAESVYEIFSSLLDGSDYELKNYSERVFLESDSLYNETSFLQADLQALGNSASRVLSWAIKNQGLESTKKNSFLLRQFSKELPDILGLEKPKTYLLLLLDNMNLRPGGGRISSYALLKIEDGKITSIEIDDVYSLDSRLKGHVEPPNEVSKYLGEEEWFMRDSNWSQDFRQNALQAEWFLEKEIDLKVDGVIAADLEFIRRALSQIEPLGVTGYDQLIDSENLYEQVERVNTSSVFSGPENKSFLTALFSEFLKGLLKNDKKSPEFFKIALGTLKERHLQVYLSNSKVENFLQELNLVEKDAKSGCGRACSRAYLKIIDANVGKNRVDGYIKRTALLTKNLRGKVLKNYLTLVYENTKEADKVDQGYKTFTKVVVFKGVSFQPIEVVGLGQRDLYEPEVLLKDGYQETGVFLEVPSGESRIVNFYWEETNPLLQEDIKNYFFSWKKQAGTFSGEVVVRFIPPEGVELKSFPAFSLTQDKSLGYNSRLLTDLDYRIFW